MPFRSSRLRAPPGLISGLVEQQTFFDDFNRADGALGANWVESGNGGSATIAGGQVGFGSGAARLYMPVSPPTGPNYFAEITTAQAATAGSSYILVVSAGDYLNLIGFVLLNTAVSVQQRLAGGVMTLGTGLYTSGFPAPGSVLRAEMVNSLLTVKLNGEVLVALQLMMTVSGVGIQARGLNTPALDNFRCGNLIAA